MYVELEDIDQGEDGVPDWVRVRTMYLDIEDTDQGENGVLGS